MPLRHDGIVREKDNEKTLDETENPIVNNKQEINCKKPGRNVNQAMNLLKFKDCIMHMLKKDKIFIN